MEKLMTLSDNYMLDVIDVNVKIEDTQILQDITFSTTSGNILAILGPTGSGKTTLMNSISGRQSTVSGHVLFNQRPFSEQTRRRLGYVLQQDVFFSNLTCWETLYFTTLIRISDKVSLTDKLSMLNEIVDLLELRDCLHTVMGDLFTKGLSGGEKKRTGIACELLTNPDILLMDEPTSGLDSCTAQSLMTKMKQLAAYSNKMVLVTIHQPSSRLYQMFDSILLLARGQVVYFGKAHDDPLEFFQKFGHVCEPNFNPADFYMEVLKSDRPVLDKIVSFHRDQMAKEEKKEKLYQLKRGAEVREKTEDGWSSKISLIKKGSYETILGVDDISADTQNTTTAVKWPTGFWTQFKILTWRSFRQSRGRFLHRYDVIFYVITAVMESALFFRSKTNNYSTRDKTGLLFHTVTFWTFQGSSMCMLSIPGERGIVSKENSAGAYRLSAYYLAKTTCELPLQIIMPTLFLALVYWMTELGGVPEFFITLAILVFATITAQGLGLFLGFACIEQRIGFLANYTSILVGILFSGFITATYPPWLSWAKYISLIRYPLSSMCIVLFHDMENIPCNTTSVTEYPQCLRNGTDFVTSSDVLANAGVDLPLYSYLLIETVIFIGFRVGAYIALCYRHVVTI